MLQKIELGKDQHKSLTSLRIMCRPSLIHMQLMDLVRGGIAGQGCNNPNHSQIPRLIINVTTRQKSQLLFQLCPKVILEIILMDVCISTSLESRYQPMFVSAIILDVFLMLKPIKQMHSYSVRNVRFITFRHRCVIMNITALASTLLTSQECKGKA